MTGNQKFRFALFLAALVALEAALLLWPQFVVITGHEADMLHMLDMGLRMADGELPHLDFMTPLGILSIAPSALFLGMGFGAVKSAILADLLVCLVLLPPLWWLGMSRLHGLLRYLFGAYIVILVMALVYGGQIPSISNSLFYNRWAWAIALVVLGTVMFPVRRPMAENWVSPLVIGLGLSALAMTKATYFITLAPAVLLVLLTQKRFGLAGLSLLVGAAVAGLIAASLGLDFMLAYADNLLKLAGGQATRSHPGADLAELMGNPSSIMVTVALLGAVIVLRSGGRVQAGLHLFILAPAFIYITYQNWGNDPKWLMFLIVYLLLILPDAAQKTVFGLPARDTLKALVAVAVTAAVPSFYVMTTSPVRVAFASVDGQLPVPLAPPLADMLMGKERLQGTLVEVNLPGVTPFRRADEHEVQINGTTLPECVATSAYLNFEIMMARQLEQVTEARGKQILLADMVNPLWLLGDHMRVDNAAPWYYDDDSGFAAADYFAVPNCPLRRSSRESMVRQMNDTGWVLEQRFESALVTLYLIRRNGQ